ncbi:MAG: helix-turn-helix transcriptional regulator [Ruminiclostridium sp.]|nr:helix-turn-helix transcriptional regulator [Ruminiclostridium sp.]
MLINEQLEMKNITKYRLSKESGVPQATINDICSGKADIEKCAAGTLYRLAKVLDVSVEDILEDAKKNSVPHSRHSRAIPATM